MKRTIQIEIETSECGRYCGEECSYYIPYQDNIYYRCVLFEENPKDRMRCAACLAAESEICKPLSVEGIKKIVMDNLRTKIEHGMGMIEWNARDMAEAIHRAMTNKGG